jgi:hypothetical protein
MLNKVPYFTLAALIFVGVSAYNTGVNRGLKTAPEYLAREAEKQRAFDAESAALAARQRDLEASRMVDVGVKDPFLMYEDFITEVEIWADWKLREEAMDREYDGSGGGMGRYEN